MQKTMSRKWAGDHEFLLYSLICSNKLAYLQLIAALFYGNRYRKSHEKGT